MFGASPNPFGQGSGSSPFGSQSVFGQTSSSPANPFANKPFGSPAATSSPFAPQPGGSIFGGTSTGMFGTPQTSSPFSSTPAFGAASSPAFGSSFGAAPSTPAFGSGGGSSAFGQKPVFGGFGSNTQANPFGSTSQQSQPAFGGSGMFGSTPAFGAPSQSAFGTPTAPAFGSTSTPSFGSGGTTAFGASSTPAFGASSTPAFGASSTPAFGATSTSAFGGTSTPAFGSSAFGSTGSGFGLSNTPVFGSVGAFGASNTGSAFGSSSTPAFGATASAFGTPTASAFGASSSPAFGASGTSQFNFSSSPTFGQSTSTFGSTPFGSTTSAFGAQNSTFGSQATQPFGSPGFAQPGFAGARGGTRVANYTPTTETDTGTQPAGKLESIAAMPVYKDKSHEELRWEDYQSGDKGGPAPPGQSSGGIAFSTTPPQSNAFSTSSQFGQTSANNLFNQNKSPFGNSSPSVFAPPSNPFSTASPFSSASTSTFSNTSLFGTGTSSTPASAPSLFSSPTPQQSSPFGSTLTFNNPQTSLSASTPTFGQTGNLFGQSTPAPAFGSSSLFSGTPASTGGNFFSSTSSLSTNVGAFSQPTQSMQPFGQTTPSAPFNFANMSQTQTAFPSGFAGSPGFGQFNSGQMSSAQGVQQVPITNPFGTLPAMPQLSIGQVGTSSNVQYGISSMPVVNKPAPVRISSLLTPRHISQRRIRLAARKYHPGPKVPFFTDEEETPSTPKADALFIPRENPRALVIRPSDQWLPRTGFKVSPMKADPSAGIYENAAEDDIVNNSRHNQKSDSVENSEQTLSGHRAGEAAIVYEHGADIEALMPKLRLSDYYTEPRLQELAAKERAEPGFCRHVKDFVVGRKGYGSIKFLGETDVRRLDLESLVQFNNREVIVYMDDNKKPSIGQGLNKPAEVTLLNIKCFDKKTGCQYTEGPKIEKYKEMLKRKAEDQGAEFISYNPVKGEWKFKVNHF